MFKKEKFTLQDEFRLQKKVGIYESGEMLEDPTYLETQALAQRFLRGYIKHGFGTVTITEESKIPDVKFHFGVSEIARNMILRFAMSDTFTGTNPETRIIACSLRRLFSEILVNETENANLIKDPEVRELMIQLLSRLPIWWLRCFGPTDISWMKNPTLEIRYGRWLTTVPEGETAWSQYSIPKHPTLITTVSAIVISIDRLNKRKQKRLKNANISEPKLILVLMKYSGFTA